MNDKSGKFFKVSITTACNGAGSAAEGTLLTGLAFGAGAGAGGGGSGTAGADIHSARDITAPIGGASSTGANVAAVGFRIVAAIGTLGCTARTKF